MKLNNAASEDPAPDSLWKKVAEARRKGEPLVVPDAYCLYSRPCRSRLLTAQERDQKQYEYFALLRDPGKDAKTGEVMRITGVHVARASATTDAGGRPAVAVSLDKRGGEWLYELTSKNKPTGAAAAAFRRRLAVILDRLVVSAPTLESPIGQDAIIAGQFTQQEVDRLVALLRAGGLPAPLKPMPVREEDHMPKNK
jgi:SecD/SecF fusion protein